METKKAALIVGGGKTGLVDRGKRGKVGVTGAEGVWLGGGVKLLRRPGFRQDTHLVSFGRRGLGTGRGHRQILRHFSHRFILKYAFLGLIIPGRVALNCAYSRVLVVLA